MRLFQKVSTKVEYIEEEKNVDIDEIFESLINDYVLLKKDMIIDVRSKSIEKSYFLADARKHIKTYYKIVSEEAINKLLLRFEQYIFGYSRLTPLIEDKKITDIRCVAHDNIRVKEKGKRKESRISFITPAEFENFVNYIASKNQINLTNLNAEQVFADTKSSEDFILRFTVTLPLINASDEPFIHIRKIPKDFPEMPDLVKEGMFSKKLAKELEERFRSGSTLICGGNSSGKTSILNALKETLPHDISVQVVQHVDELTTKRHPDMMFMHSINKSGDSLVEYGLDRLSIVGLTMDVDYFILGEIKGVEARYVLNAAYTGQLCSGTLHALSAADGADKLVDYAVDNSKYSKEEMMKMVSRCFKTVLFMDDYKVMQVYEISGWNKEEKTIEYTTIYERGVTTEFDD